MLGLAAAAAGAGTVVLCALGVRLARSVARP
jgi:hypothetical protein